MPYTVAYRPSKKRPGEPWVKLDRHGHIVSRHRSKQKAKGAIAAYYASKHAHNHLVGNAAQNPLRMDPTRTTMIRRQFEAELIRRSNELIKAVRKWIATDDTLALKERTTLITMAEREFEFRTDAGKLEAFNDWIKQQVRAKMIALPPGADPSQPWTTKYIESAYKRGKLNAYLGSKRSSFADELGIGEMSQEAFLRSSFGQPESMAKVRLLGTRAFRELEGIGPIMETRMNRILAQGMIDGRGPEAIAKEMADQIKSITRSRALLIARTEVIHAHAEGALDMYEELGVEDVSINAEWSTAGDERVCPRCEAREGNVYSLKEARGLIPLHPNCRCSWVPTEEEPTSKEEKARKEIAAEQADEAPPPRDVLERNLAEAQAALAAARAAGASAEELAQKKHAVALAQRAIRRDNKRIAKATGIAPTQPKPTAAQPTPAAPAPVKGVRYAAPKDYHKAVLDVENLEETAGLRNEIALNRIEMNRHQERASELWRASAQPNLPAAEVERIREEIRQVQKQAATASQALGGNLNQLRKLNKDAALKVLFEEDNLADAVSFSPTNVPLKHQAPMRDVLRMMPSSQYSSTEINRFSVLRVTEQAELHAAGSYSKEFKRINLVPGRYNNSVIAHEFGHHISYQASDIYKKQQDFFDRRTIGDRIQRLPGYGRQVRGKKDLFGRVSHYAGRVYSDGRAPEAIAVGVEHLYQDPVGFAKADPDFFSMVVSALKRL